MKPESSRTTFVAIVDKPSQEYVKNERKTLQVLQQAAGKDKENLVGVSRSLRSNAKETIKEVMDEKQLAIQEHLTNTKNAVHANKRQKKMPNAAKGKSKVTAEDLMTMEGPSEKYWSVLAEKRRIALETALEENKQLHDRIKLLEEENESTKQLLAETNGVIAILREMVEDEVPDTSLDMSSTDCETSVAQAEVKEETDSDTFPM